MSKYKYLKISYSNGKHSVKVESVDHAVALTVYPNDLSVVFDSRDITEQQALELLVRSSTYLMNDKVSALVNEIDSLKSLRIP